MDHAKKKRVKRYVTWGVMALVVVLLAAMPLLARQEAEADGPVASVLSATVEEGAVNTSLRGGGTLVADGVEEVTLPDSVKITEFLVKNGQIVTEGTPLATVDKVSVMTAITEVSETLEYLREELEDARNEKVSASIKATAGGRVKKVFAQEGDSVQEVMLRDGALAILSIDGMMAVKLEGDMPLTTGESVTVHLPDVSVEGRVESNLDGVIIITVEDDGYEIGQSVTVTMEDGTGLGEGMLYVHNAWKATAYTGTIETVSAKEEKTLSSGATLFTLTDRDFEAELQHRSSQHREYEQLLQELFQMYESGVLTAPCDGEVEGIDEDSPYLLSASVPDGWVLAPLNNVTGNSEEKGWTVMLLGSVTSNTQCSDDKNCQWMEQDLSKHGENCVKHCTKAAECQVNTHYDDCLSFCKGDRNCPAKNHVPGCKSVCTGKAGCEAPQTKHLTGCPEKCTDNDACKSSRPLDEHGSNCIVHCLKDTDGSDGSACSNTYHYPMCVGNCTGLSTCTAQNHVHNCYWYDVIYTARVGIFVRYVSGTMEYKFDKNAQPVTLIKDASGNLVPTSMPSTTTMNDTDFVASGVQCNAGSVIMIVTASKPDGTELFSNQVYVLKQGSGGMGEMDKDALAAMMAGMGKGFDISSMIGNFAGFGNYGYSSTEESEPLFDLEGNQLLTVTPQDTMLVYISIDEHDIAKVSLGMKATVKVEALKGQEFEAEVTGIALTGTSNGGSSKFTVELTLDMGEDMLAGMSAAAVIPLETKEKIPVLPAEALIQDGARTIVYTALDENGEPTAPVEVTTGASDGTHVEVTSGVGLGQKVYYKFYDTYELDTSAEAEKYTLR